MASPPRCAVVGFDEGITDLPDIAALLNLDRVDRATTASEENDAFLCGATVVTNDSESKRSATSKSSTTSSADAPVKTSTRHRHAGGLMLTGCQDNFNHELFFERNASALVSSSEVDTSDDRFEPVARRAKDALGQCHPESPLSNLKSIDDVDMMPEELDMPSHMHLAAFEPQPLSLEADNCWDELLMPGAAPCDEESSADKLQEPLTTHSAFLDEAASLLAPAEASTKSESAAAPSLKSKRKLAQSAGAPKKKGRCSPGSKYISRESQEPKQSNINIGRALLYSPADDTQLSEQLCLVRAQMEAFAAGDEDVEDRRKLGGKSCYIVIGQVGLRCVHCTHLPLRDRAKGAVAFPKSIKNVYQCVRNFKRDHVNTCTFVPDDVHTRLLALGEQRKHSRKAVKYFAESCAKMGLIESGEGKGIFFMDSPYTTADEGGSEGTERVNGDNDDGDHDASASNTDEGDDASASDADSFMGMIDELPGVGNSPHMNTDLGGMMSLVVEKEEVINSSY